MADSKTTVLRGLNLDRYDRNARLQPALLVLLPLLVLAGVWYPAARTGYGWLLSLMVVCGATYLMAQFARSRGRALEAQWGDRIGRRHSVRLLSHADREIPAAQKMRVAEWVRAHGPGLPSEEDERRDPVEAAERRAVGMAWLLEATRPEAAESLLLNENVSYGFWRNMRGLRPFGLGSSLVAAILDVALLVRAGVADDRFPLGIACGVFCGLSLIAWSRLVSVRAVENASRVYADRLFAQIDNPSINRRMRKKSGKKTTRPR